MKLIDWRELYAANRAVIEGREPGVAATAIAHPVPSAQLPPGATPAPTGAPAMPVAELLPAPPRALRAPPAPAPGVDGRGGGAGTWERLAYGSDRQERNAFVYTPPGLTASTPAPVVVMLHGCTQTAAGFAAATRMNVAADRHGFVAVYPEQSRSHNQQGCWNWFASAHHARTGDEPAFIAGAARAVLAEDSRWAVDERRIFVAGLSAGGAMAAVLAATHPDLFAAVAVHSGLAYGSARSLPAAMSAMRSGGPDPEQQGRAAHAAMGHAARPVPAITIHGTADAIVSPVNGEHVVRQSMATNRLASRGRYDADFARPASTTDHRSPGGRRYRRRTWTDSAGSVVQEHIEVQGMGHAWSGGSVGGSYTDPLGPSAAEAIWDFFDRVSRQPSH